MQGDRLLRARSDLRARRTPVHAGAAGPQLGADSKRKREANATERQWERGHPVDERIGRCDGHARRLAILQPHLLCPRDGAVQGPGLGIHTSSDTGCRVSQTEKEHQSDSRRPPRRARGAVPRDCNRKSCQAVSACSIQVTETSRQEIERWDRGFSVARGACSAHRHNAFHDQPHPVEMGGTRRCDPAPRSRSLSARSLDSPGRGRRSSATSSRGSSSPSVRG